jgi:hypothetical protein
VETARGHDVPLCATPPATGHGELHGDNSALEPTGASSPPWSTRSVAGLGSEVAQA